ncbi:MAG TPA: hypothetical protein ENJ53_02335 [Phaeodactylibacter sp.]|nr:hypothetical protein [Phaeodactylibacter sp.]
MAKGEMGEIRLLNFGSLVNVKKNKKFMFKPSKEEVEKYGLTPKDKFLEAIALTMVIFALLAFFIKILFL